MPPNRNILGGIEIGEYGDTQAVLVAKFNPNRFPRYGLNQRQEWKRVHAFGQKTGWRNIP